MKIKTGNIIYILYILIYVQNKSLIIKVIFIVYKLI